MRPNSTWPAARVPQLMRAWPLMLEAAFKAGGMNAVRAIGPLYQ
jgi:hypothetical protein